MRGRIGDRQATHLGVALSVPFLLKCPYCAAEVKLVDSTVVYGRSYDTTMYVCSNYPKCDAYVGCHRGTNKPLGRLANAELRKAKCRAHTAFDTLWNRKMRREKCSKREARTAGYRWLSKQLNIPAAECHIGMMDVERCNDVAMLCALYLR